VLWSSSVEIVEAFFTAQRWLVQSVDGVVGLLTLPTLPTFP
jgi:hypothetical protein